MVNSEFKNIRNQTDREGKVVDKLIDCVRYYPKTVTYSKTELEAKKIKLTEELAEVQAMIDEFEEDEVEEEEE